ncbi:uncharacterized protein [Nerophis lumbriciformis]|uniref:uncharacterized protein n=1 Tax=Nerophis lumbriciformis TaxID=546530 RepID=UPI002ADF3D2B|nr:uncharacterized protein LOC133575674 [Nerophis lumbriciformis]
MCERTIAEYEEELSRTKEEKRQLLDAVYKKHQVVLHRTDVQQRPHIKEEEEDPQSPHLKEEEEECWIIQEGECLLGQEEEDVSKFPLTVVSVKTEEHEDKAPESSQLHHSPIQQDPSAEEADDEATPKAKRKRTTAFSEEEKEEIIDFLLQHEVLYSKRLAGFKDVSKKEKLWAAQAEKMGMTVADLKTWYTSMRTMLGRLKKRARKSAMADLNATEQWVWDKFGFLRPHIETVEPRNAALFATSTQEMATEAPVASASSPTGSQGSSQPGSQQERMTSGELKDLLVDFMTRGASGTASSFFGRYVEESLSKLPGDLRRAAEVNIMQELHRAQTAAEQRSTVPTRPAFVYRQSNPQEYQGLAQIGNAVPPTTLHASSDVPPTATPASPMAKQTAPMDQIVPLVLQVLPVFDIRQILRASPGGRLIVQRLDEDGVITIKQRYCLVRILVSHVMEKFGDSPSSHTKNTMASSLVQTFPCLKDTSDSGHEIWYTQGRNYRPATGFLEERLRNIRKRKRSLSRPTRQEDSEPERVCIPDSTISDERAERMKEWLRHNSQPLGQVWAYMQDTVLYRARWIRVQNSKNVSEILKEFPHLTTQGMIAQDFQVLHGEAAPKLSETWLPVYTEKILSLARREGKLALRADEMALDAKWELAFKVLPAMLPPTVYKVGGKVFRHTIEESRLAFIDCRPVGTNIMEYLQHAEVSRSYPYVLSLGDDRLQCSCQSFVILAGQALEQSTLLGAVDVCFKAFHIFDISYPKQCAPVWEFLQKVVYEMGGGESTPVNFLHTAILACK